MPLIERKRAELDRKLQSIDEEFKRWHCACAPGKSWQKHHWQIHSVTGRLAGFQTQIRGQLKDASEDEFLPVADEMSKMVLSVHRIWEFFRVKLEQRREPAFFDYLRFADEFAWLCYRPILPFSIYKEPPLVFLNGGSSPFTLTRDVGYEAEAVPRELITDGDLRKALAKVPFPVIGIPWYQIVHLPEAVVIGHEVGHSVETDLDLKDELNRIINAALDASGGCERHVEWLSWRSELFADAYGCLSAGPAFVAALIDYLAAAASSPLSDQPLIGDYPPAILRIPINVAFLRAMGHKEETINLLTADWNNSCSLPSRLEPYLKDACELAERLLKSPLTQIDNQKLTSLLTFSPDSHASAVQIAANAASRKDAPKTSDFRVLLAAVQIAYSNDPPGYDRKLHAMDRPPATQLKDRLLALLQPQLRSGEKKKELDAAAEAKFGEAWFDELRAAKKSPRSIELSGRQTDRIG